MLDRILDLLFPLQNIDFTSLDTYLSDNEIKNCRSKLKKITKNQKENIEAIIVISEYSNVLVHDLIHRAKYLNEWKIAHSFAEAIYQKIFMDGSIFIPDPNLIIPVPSDPKRYAQRGYNLPSKISDSLSLKIQTPSKELLIKKHSSIAQNKLTRKERLSNLNKVFDLNSNVRINFTDIETVWLIDDISTTGSTLVECAKVLKKKYPFINIYGVVISSN
jgi:ComF family protein